MRNIERQTDYPGKPTELIPRYDYPLAWASCEDELLYYLRNLVDMELLSLPVEDNPEINEMATQVQITATGWEYLDQHSKTSIISDQAFVAMRFSEDLEGLYENAIKKAIEDAGYKAYRIDRENHGNRIDVKIMAEIKNSRFLVADVTHQNQGVYFEAGYALGLGIPVIWSCREEDFEKRHFDTKQYQHIKWATGVQLREDLFNFICAIIGKNT